MKMIKVTRYIPADYTFENKVSRQPIILNCDHIIGFEAVLLSERTKKDRYERDEVYYNPNKKRDPVYTYTKVEEGEVQTVPLVLIYLSKGIGLVNLNHIYVLGSLGEIAKLIRLA